MRILVGYFVDGKHSGIDTYLLNFIQTISQENVQIDLLTNRIIDDVIKKYKINNLNIIEIPRLKHPIKQYKKMDDILKKNKYDIAYFNISEAFNSIGILASKRNNVKKIIIHSHASGTDCRNYISRIALKLLNMIFKHIIWRWANCYYACSEKAAKWLFPKRITQNHKYKIIYNAIDDLKYEYKEEIRNQKRAELNLQDKVILGHIGNFCYVKNQEFLLQVIKELEDCYHLVLVGTGSDYTRIKKKIQKLNLNEKVTLLGLRNDVNELLQAFDMFLLPSKFEGLGIVGIEAQFSGLPCVFSNEVPEEILINSNSVRIPLKVKKWKQQIEEYKKVGRHSQIKPNNKIEKYSLDKQKQQFLDILL